MLEFSSTVLSTLSKYLVYIPCFSFLPDFSRRVLLMNAEISVRYFLRVTVVKWLSDIVKELPLAVRTVSPHSGTNCSIKMEVGIEDSLHIEFEYNKSRFQDISDSPL